MKCSHERHQYPHVSATMSWRFFVWCIGSKPMYLLIDSGAAMPKESKYMAWVLPFFIILTWKHTQCVPLFRLLSRPISFSRLTMYDLLYCNLPKESVKSSLKATPTRGISILGARSSIWWLVSILYSRGVDYYIHSSVCNNLHILQNVRIP